YYVEWGWRWSTDPQTLERVFVLAQKALTLDNSLPIAHSLLSWVYAWKQQYDQATAEGEQAIALDPNNADSCAFRADTLSYGRRRWLRHSGPSPSMTPPPWVTCAWALSICGKSSMSRPSPRWSGLSPSIPMMLLAMHFWLRR